MRHIDFMYEIVPTVAKWTLDQQLEWALDARISDTAIGLYYGYTIYAKPHLILSRKLVSQAQLDKLCLRITVEGGTVLWTEDMTADTDKPYDADTRG